MVFISGISECQKEAPNIFWYSSEAFLFFVGEEGTISKVFFKEIKILLYRRENRKLMILKLAS